MHCCWRPRAPLCLRWRRSRWHRRRGARPALSPAQRPALKLLSHLQPDLAGPCGYGPCGWLDSENRFYVKVRNAGPAAAGASKARVEFGHHTLQFAVPPLGAGQSVRVGGVYLPQDIFDANGAAAFSVAVDYGNAVAEANEGNNRRSSRIRLQNVLRGMELAPPDSATPASPPCMVPDPQ